MLAAPFSSAEVDKFDAAFARKGRTGLGFTAHSDQTTTTPYQTQAQREILSSSTTSSSFSASAYLHKFGWKAGTGLGKREDGRVSYVKVSKKEDQAGIGAGLAVQAIARSFETVFNNAARNFNVVIHDDSDEDEDERNEEKEEERKEAQKEQKKNEKKRKRREEQKEEHTQPTSDESPTTATASPPSATNSFIRPAIAFKSASSPTSSHSTTDSLSLPVVAPDSLLSFDSSRSHMYHDRCKGKLARLQAQESMGQHIVEAVKRKRWEGMHDAREERKEAAQESRDQGPVIGEAEETEEHRIAKRKAEKKERKRREREGLQKAEQERKEEPLTNELVEAEEEAERKRQKNEKKEAKRRRQIQ